MRPSKCRHYNLGLYIRDECKWCSGKCKRELYIQDSTEGDVSFNITAFDLAGNNFTADQTQLNSSNVIIDRTNPQLVDLVVYSDNNNISLARIGDVVTITLNVTESLQNATISILNNTIDMTRSE